MLVPGRTPMTEQEEAAVDKLMAEQEGEPISLTRRDPGETGPLLVHAGDSTWEISEDGKRKKVS
jgi:hypothetical protein